MDELLKNLFQFVLDFFFVLFKIHIKFSHERVYRDFVTLNSWEDSIYIWKNSVSQFMMKLTILTIRNDMLISSAHFYVNNLCCISYVLINHWKGLKRSGQFHFLLWFYICVYFFQGGHAFKVHRWVFKFTFWTGSYTDWTIVISYEFPSH